MNRSLLIEKPSKLSYSNECIVVEQDNVMLTIPLNEIDVLVVDNCQSVITTALINKLIEAHIDTLMCGKKHMPDVRLSDLNGNTNRNGRILEQLSWNATAKDSAWLQIVMNKMRNQIVLAESMCGRVVKMPCSSNMDNNEGILARMYFSKLFGRGFVRHADDDINAMLNYGYSLLLSRVAKIIVTHGYLTQLGLHHCSKTNNYNFVCDIMEPFRPAVDKIAFYHKSERFGRSQKMLLLDIFNEKVNLLGKRFDLADAMNVYFELICDYLNGKRDEIPEVRVI